MPSNMSIGARMHRHDFTELKEGTWKMRKRSINMEMKIITLTATKEDE